MKFRFIFNPRSGHNARNPGRLLQRTHDFIRAHQLDATVVLTERPRHASDLARQAVAEGCDVVVAIGGDGTMNEIASALVGTPAVLGLIPSGSGNGLGRHLGIPGPGHGAFRNLLSGTPRVMDSGTANGLPFFNAMGLGFDAEISERFARAERRGLWAYVRLTLAAWRSFQPVRLRVRTAGETLDVSAFIAAVANSDQYGNNFYIAPGARVDDGQLDLTVIKPVRLISAAILARRFFARRVDDSPHLVRLRSDHFILERDAPGPIHTDGEPHQTGATVEVRVRPQSLRVLAPAVGTTVR